tara:strand:- start:7213 stop:7488 length:276 start_codon:yes stop_codon:yes gene_type:complete
MDYFDPHVFEVPISDTTSPSIVVVALAKWINQMDALDAHGNAGHREVLAVLLRLVKIWAEELQDNSSYEELGNQLLDNVIGAIGQRNLKLR